MITFHMSKKNVHQ